MAIIEVIHEKADYFRVHVHEGGSTTHVVTVTDQALARYGHGLTKEALLEASFRFLLEREPKESILFAFDLPVIERYFPEYATAIGTSAEGDA